MRPPNNISHAAGAGGGGYKRYASILVVVLLSFGLGMVGYRALPQAGCNEHFMRAAAHNASRSWGATWAAALTPDAAAAATAASAAAKQLPPGVQQAAAAVTGAAAGSMTTTASPQSGGVAMFAPLLPALLPRTNFSQLPAAAILDAAMAHGSQPPQLRAMMQLQQQLFCDASADKVPWPGTVGVRFANVTLFVYESGDIVSSSIAGGARTWESTEIQEWLWAIRQWKPQPRAAAAASTLAQQATAVAAGAVAAATGGAVGSEMHAAAAAAAANAAQDRPLVVDIGGNIGWFTLNAAAAGARVASFEAMPSNIALMRRSLCASPWLAERIALYGIGLAEANSSCWIISGTGNRGDGIMVCDRHRAQHTKGYEVRGEISLRRLDTLLNEDVQVMKIDVEGYEHKVLQGAAALLQARRVRYIMAECNTGIIGEDAGRAFIRFLDRVGYEVSPVSFRGPFWGGDEVRAGASCSNINLYARVKGLGRR